MNMEQLVECELAKVTEVLGKKPALMPLCPPQISHELTMTTWDACFIIEIHCTLMDVREAQ
jgi:hypothetical protein